VISALKVPVSQESTYETPKTSPQGRYHSFRMPYCASTPCRVSLCRFQHSVRPSSLRLVLDGSKSSGVDMSQSGIRCSGSNATTYMYVCMYVCMYLTAAPPTVPPQTKSDVAKNVLRQTNVEHNEHCNQCSRCRRFISIHEPTSTPVNLYTFTPHHHIPQFRNHSTSPLSSTTHI